MKFKIYKPCINGVKYGFGTDLRLYGGKIYTVVGTVIIKTSRVVHLSPGWYYHTINEGCYIFKNDKLGLNSIIRHYDDKEGYLLQSSNNRSRIEGCWDYKDKIEDINIYELKI